MTNNVFYLVKKYQSSRGLFNGSWSFVQIDFIFKNYTSFFNILNF